MARPELSGASRAVRILAAAERLFAQRGYAGTSMHAIGKAARVSKAAVFHHFRSKESLYMEVVGGASREFAEQLNAALPQRTALGHQVAVFADQQLEHMLRRRQITRIILREIGERRTARNQRLAEEVLGANFARLLDVLRTAQTAKLIRKDVDCAAAACLLIAANVFFFQSQHLLAYLPGVSFGDDPAAYSRLTSRVILEGILEQRTASSRQRARTDR